LPRYTVTPTAWTIILYLTGAFAPAFVKTLTLNPYAIVASILVAQLVPILWYDGLWFETWLEYNDLSARDIEVIPSHVYLISISSSVGTVLFVAYLFRSLGVESVVRGGLLGAGMAFFFSFLDLWTHNNFELRPLGITLIDGGKDLIVGASVGALLGGWRTYRQPLSSDELLEAEATARA